MTGDDITDAERQMRVMGQNPLFMIREGDASLDTQLAQRDYQVSDPTLLYVAPTEALVADLPLTDAMPSWPPLAVQRELWANGGVDSARVAVMERAKGLKTAILGRSGDVPAGTAFVDMRNRIERQIETRTLMLSGVSHDLRTPLTRMRLALSMLEDEDRAALEQDVDDMQRMIAAFLSFIATISSLSFVFLLFICICPSY